MSNILKEVAFKMCIMSTVRYIWSPPAVRVQGEGPVLGEWGKIIVQRRGTL
jgi:hypothetical protein